MCYTGRGQWCRGLGTSTQQAEQSHTLTGYCWIFHSSTGVTVIEGLLENAAALGERTQVLHRRFYIIVPIH